MSTAEETTERSIAERVDALDWPALEAELDRLGHAHAPAVLTPAECAALAALYPDDRHFRSRVDMARVRFGLGGYGYFARPLPPLVAALREALYPRLAPLANRWSERLRGGYPGAPYPPHLEGFLAHCHAQGQTRPTPLLLHYPAEGFNCLHQDMYGAVYFPVQATVFLSRRGVDYAGGHFLLTEQRPRQQSRGEALDPEQGELVLFASNERPVQGRRGYHRARMRHGVSRITAGERYALGIIFHDAR